MKASTLDYQRIQNSLSAVRLSTFEQATKTLPQALELYQWNMQVSAAFLPCLQLCEVVTRNSVAQVLTFRHGNRWAWERGYIGTLPNPKKGTYYQLWLYDTRSQTDTPVSGATFRQGSGKGEWFVPIHVTTPVLEPYKFELTLQSDQSGVPAQLLLMMQP